MTIIDTNQRSDIMARRLGVRTRRTGHSRRFNTKTENTILVNQNAQMGPAGGPSPPHARHGWPGLPSPRGWRTRPRRARSSPTNKNSLANSINFVLILRAPTFGPELYPCGLNYSVVRVHLTYSVRLCGSRCSLQGCVRVHLTCG